MTLTEYFEREGRGSASRLASAIGAFNSDVSDWASGKRPVPVRFALPIEAATGGAVTRQVLCPDDWQAIWPELATHAAITPKAEAAPDLAAALDQAGRDGLIERRGSKPGRRATDISREATHG